MITKKLLPYEREEINNWLKINSLYSTKSKEGKKMDISNFTKQQGQFLKAEDVQKDPSAEYEITDEAQIVHNEKYNVNRLHIPVKSGDLEFVFDCSKTNSRVIEKILGSDTVKWISKKLVLEIYKTKTSEGKMTDAINVKEVRV